jgi:hypothetical protein
LNGGGDDGGNALDGSDDSSGGNDSGTSSGGSDSSSGCMLANQFSCGTLTCTLAQVCVMDPTTGGVCYDVKQSDQCTSCSTELLSAPGNNLGCPAQYFARASGDAFTTGCTVTCE